MRRFLHPALGGLFLITIAYTPASADVIAEDPVGDFLSSYTGPRTPDLDITSFTIDFNRANSTFTVGVTLAGAINPASGPFMSLG